MGSHHVADRNARSSKTEVSLNTNIPAENTEHPTDFQTYQGQIKDFSWGVAEPKKMGAITILMFWPKKWGLFLQGRGPRPPGPRPWIRPCISPQRERNHV